MASPYTLFEISWEVCNKVGGIHTVISTKAATIVERMSDDYVAIGPWLLSESSLDNIPFVEDPSFLDFAESCRAMGIPVRVGRWQIPGSPRTILVEFSSLFDKKDDVLSELWEGYGVDSLSGEWDYVEPVLFGYAAGRVIERWWEDYLAPYHRRAVVQAHEWMTSSSLLYLKPRIPSVGTVFTTHATMLGRALSTLGHSPDDGLGDQTVRELAETHGVVAKHSMEGVAAREADVFTTVSEITSKEAELLHERKPHPVLPNGIDLDVIDSIAGEVGREAARKRLIHLANQFLGEDTKDAMHLCASGRYEFHNKGIDILLEALGRMNGNSGRAVVLWILVPAGNSGVRSRLLERMEQTLEDVEGPIGLSTHNLFDEDTDPVHESCARLGLENTVGSRIKIVQVPVYLDEADGFLGLPYEAVLRAMDLSCFPSYYEPWGYTPQESLAVGVPTITTDYAGFGRWAISEGLEPADGITILPRVHADYETVVERLEATIEQFLAESPTDLYEACRRTAALTEWSDLIVHYFDAYGLAIEAIQERSSQGVIQTRRRPKLVTVQPTPDGRKPRLVSFDVASTLPEELRGLHRLARNLWWSWDGQAPSLFEELSRLEWERCHHNPFAFLHRVPAEDLAAKAADPDYIARLADVLARFENYMTEETPVIPLVEGGASAGAPLLTREHPVAYFCAEYGLHESLPIYSGGLGVLAGDHLKSASDTGLPLVAIGLFYRMGYMNQRVTPAGVQIAEDVENDPKQLPLTLVNNDDGTPLELRIQLPGRTLFLRAWRVAVGRVNLYLLDSNTPSNRVEDRDITRNLYGGDSEQRLQQEIALGRGGQRLLKRLGIEPSAFHMNEGHAAFLSLERVSYLVREEGLTFSEAREYVRATTAFTTHTPVPAGHDRFSEDLVRRYFSDAEDWVGVPWERFVQLARAAGSPENADFNMTYLALSFASVVNGVSKLHGIASRELLHPYWPGLLEAEVPVRTITNGIHLPTWQHPDLDASASDRELWEHKGHTRHRLLDEVRVRLKRNSVEQHDSPLILNKMLDGLDENALVIGFARRFAPYKRAHLLFEDPERLAAILSNADRPVRILIAGKAHPRDEPGQGILKRIVGQARSEEFAGKVFFVEGYGMNLARSLVRGVDVWLNNPTRMLEASGTSGMKAAANGGLNLSIGDGWWPEANDGSNKNGWTIAGKRTYEDQDLQDQMDASALYRLLEEEIVPAFFERDANGIPTAWLERVRTSLATIPPVFNTDRMVTEYLDVSYRGLARNHYELSPERKSRVKSRAEERGRLRRGFEKVRIVSAVIADLSDLKVGDAIDMELQVELGELTTDDVQAELALQCADGDGVETIALECQSAEDGVTHFTTTYTLERSGCYSYGLRVRCLTQNAADDPPLDLVLWA